MYLYIKTMVCTRCKMAVQVVLDTLGIPYHTIEMGRVELIKELTGDQHSEVRRGLEQYELELMDNNRIIIAERIKNVVREMINSPTSEPTLKFTVVLSETLKYDYTYLSNIFTEVEGSTIERFYITTRIGRVKELIFYEDMRLKEISYLLNYSSVAHLCLQFKKITGQRPSEFRTLSHSLAYSSAKWE